ncbi:hypothetical protein DRN86_05130 [Candidatus Geothermarchaeota archaeon]|nr:MAG: hypothetical protein DRN86_05130 [Candidatus Geothermarchaeota archaeon]
MASKLPLLSSDDIEERRVLEVARAMCVAARTAPRTKGVDNIVTAIVYGKEDLGKIADEMERLSERWKFFKRDAENIRKSIALVLIGSLSSGPYKLDCGACGYASCNEFERAVRREGLAFVGPTCLYDILNLGIAIGSAVKIASENCVDNRVMYSAGVAARKLGYLKADVVIGIPLSATGKNIYFDRQKRRY